MPILFIRDIKKFQPDHLHKFFEYLHQIKEEKVSPITFLVILETSDNLWMSEAYTDTSNSAFTFYYLPPMSYMEGKEEMVVKYAMFDDKTYDDLYLQFGGHIRFYVQLWKETSKLRSYGSVMEYLEQESRIILNTCMMKLTQRKVQDEVINLFISLKNSNFRKVTPFLSATIQRLIKCNLLFYNADEAIIMVQNRLLEKEIIRFIDLVQQKHVLRLFES